jgi:hypothetical protein
MAWVDGQAFRLFLPALDDVCIRREALEGFQPFSNVVGLQTGIEMLFELLMMFVVIACDRCCWQGAIHAFDLAIGPGMARRGEARLTASLRTGLIAGMEEGEAFRKLTVFLRVCPLTKGCQRCARRAVIRQDRVDRVGYCGAEGPQAVGSAPACGLLLPLGNGKRARPIDGHEAREAAFCRRHLGHGDLDVAQRLGLELSRGRRGAFHLRETAEAMALVAAVPRGPGQVREAVLQGREEVIQG